MLTSGLVQFKQEQKETPPMLTEMQEPGAMKQKNGTGREVGYYSTKYKKNIQNETQNRSQERGQAQERGHKKATRRDTHPDDYVSILPPGR